MGFFSSFKRQLGRDTGKYVSNKLFGDKHASKYQRVNGTGKSLLGSKNKISREDSSHSDSFSFFKTSGNFLLEKTKTSLEAQRREEIYLKQIQQEDAIKLKKSIEKLISMKIPNQKSSLINMMFQLSSIISHNPYKNALEEDKVWEYTNIVLKKYEQCLYILKTKFPKANEISFFEKKYRKKKRKALWRRYYPYILLGILLLIAGMMAYFEDK